MTWSLLAVCDACTPPYEFKLGSVDAEIYSCLNALIIDGALPTRLSPFPSLPPRAPQLLQPSNQQHFYFICVCVCVCVCVCACVRAMTMLVIAKLIATKPDGSVPS